MKKKIQISKLTTNAPKSADEDKMVDKREKISKEIGKYAMKMSAETKQSLLVVLQGMDASGKDGVARKVFRYCSPSMCHAHSFKKPSEEEFAHDFLWRVHKHAPAKGHIQIFIRSHYEDILIQRVHKWITPKKVTARINAINAFEDLLKQDNNTTVLKFFLNISPERQLEKLQERIDDPERNWKHKDGDWVERKYWKDYMKCYQDAMNRSTTPWIPVPADQRWYRDYFVATEVLKAFKKMNPILPVLKEKPVFK